MIIKAHMSMSNREHHPCRLESLEQIHRSKKIGSPRDSESGNFLEKKIINK